MSESWIDRAEAALRAGRAKSEGDKLLRGRRPPLLDADGVTAVLAPMLAALVWAAAIFREQVAGSPVDPLALGLRVLAFGLTFRVVVLGGQFLRRFATFLSAGRFGLVLTPEGLLYRAPGMDVAVAKEDIVGVRERGTWQKRRAGRRWSEVYVVTNPASGRTHVELPPVFEDTPGLLAERLMRWLGGGGVPRAPEDHTPAEPAALASKLYDDVAAGQTVEGVTAIHHGYDWLRKAPYLPVVFALAALDGLARGGPELWSAVGPLLGGAIFVVVLAVPARWYWMTRRDVHPRRGLSLVLTPAEALMRTAKGMIRVKWASLDLVSTDAKRKWSVLEGAHDLRILVFTRRNLPVIRYEEPYLGVPVEVAEMLVQAYRDGRLPPGSTPLPVDEEE